MKVWSCFPWIPNSLFFLLVVLLLILLINGRFCDQRPDWRNSYGSVLASRSSHFHQGQVPSHKLHRRNTNQESCEGVSDVYLVLDKSHAFPLSWPYIHQFAVDVANSLPNPRIRLSIITYSCKGNLILPPTSNREEIQKGLERLKYGMVAGHLALEKGYRKVVSEIKKAKARGDAGSSMVISVQTKPVALDSSIMAVKNELKKLQKLGASVHTVGINIVDEFQILEFAERPENAFPMKHSYKNLPSIVPELISRACPTFTSVDKATVCAKESYKVVLRGHGFLYGKGNDRIICRFKMSDSKVIDESPISVGKYSLTCPGPMLEQPGQKAVVELSLDKGKTFLSNNVDITSEDCGLTTAAAQEQLSTTETPPSSENPPKITTTVPPITSKLEKVFVKNKRFIFVPIGLSLLLTLLLLGCLWQLCCPPPVKQPPPDPKSEKKSRKKPVPPPTPGPVNVYPTIIICCCACRGVCESRDMEGNIFVCNNDHSRRHQVPLTWAQLSEQGRYPNFDFRRALCTQSPSSPRICLGPGQEYLPLAGCSQYDLLSARCSRPPSRMLPFLLPPAQINRRTVFSLPPP